VILYLCASSWKNKKCFDIIDARCKHEDMFVLLLLFDFQSKVTSRKMCTVTKCEIKVAESPNWLCQEMQQPDISSEFL
jgi:hypothetical protein